MRTKTIYLLFFLSGMVGKLNAQFANPCHCNIGIVYPISTNGIHAKEYSNVFSLHAVAGVSRNEKGLSLAGFSNIILDSAAGLQIAGFMNITRKDATGLQMAGFINKSRDAGSQMAGFINIARKVKGVQIAGFINIADSSDYPIGIFNFIKHGEKTIGISTDETLTTLLSFRSGGRKLYGIAGVGYNDKGSRRLAAWEAGIGMHLYLAENFRLNLELVNAGLTNFKTGDYFRSSIRALPALRLSHRLEIFAGPTFSYMRSRKGTGEDLLTHYTWSRRDSDGLQALYFGVTGGIAISLTKK
jgi:hypothetical protein